MLIPYPNCPENLSGTFQKQFMKHFSAVPVEFLKSFLERSQSSLWRNFWRILVDILGEFLNESYKNSLRNL